MKPHDSIREKHILQNQEEYQVRYNFLHFLSDPEAESALEQRRSLLAQLKGISKTGYKGTKIDISDLSPGCKICGEGTWSCLFINGICNSRCFYCPSPQHEIGEPETNSLIFPQPGSYSDYIKTFGFKGVSISGGEPLLTFEKSISFIREVRNKLGNDIHIWLYTNGKLFNREKAQKLSDAGLNEIRFDIGATDYNLDRLKEAIGIIPIVTVEIPAIPEDFELMKQKLWELKTAGVNFLNLHQLRLTPYNFNQLIENNYTFLHGEKVTVLESELTALRLILYEKTNQINLPINYCSFVFKNRFQKSSARRRHAKMVIYPWESITESGYIRSFKFIPENTEMMQLIDSYKEKIFIDHQQKVLYFNADLLPEIIQWNGIISVQHFVSQISPQPTGLNDFKAIPLNQDRKIIIEKRALKNETILSGRILELYREIIQGKTFEEMNRYPELLKLREYDIIEPDLQDYY